MFDTVFRNARLPERPEPVDIGVAAGRIAAIEQHLVCDAPEHDCGGCLVCGGLVESHIHLDKTRIVDRCRPTAGRPTDAMREVSEAKRGFTVEDVRERARATLERCIAHGTTRMRTHVEVDPIVGLRGLEGVRSVLDEYRWAIEAEICVFPQEGLLNNPGTDELMVAALRAGAEVVGAAPGYDTDPAGQIRRVFDLAREYDVDIDMHLDLGDAPEPIDAPLVCRLAEEYGWGGRVMIGHATKLSRRPPSEQAALARRLADAGVAIAVLPATDLFLMGRDQEWDIRRGVVDAGLFRREGCTCCFSTNNVLNPFTPYGDGSLVRMANLGANVLQIADEAGLAACFDMITAAPARLMNLADYGVAIGNPADLVWLDAATPTAAVAENATALGAWKGGRRTVTRERPILHRP